ncbi:MAG: hypothetical protein JWL84_1836, partial [Rhodospirillales bacterium]|nr:hypothetical protein [Rhodospirillales bacterium]
FETLWRQWRALREVLDACSDDQLEAAEERLAIATDTLMRVPANGIDAVATKLSVLLDLAAIEVGDAGGFPWPQIRIVLADLRRLAGSADQSP